MNDTTIVRSSLHISLPWPPSLSAYYRPIGWTKRNEAGKVIATGAKLVRTRKARIYRDSVICFVRAKMGPVISPFTKPVRVEMIIREPDRRMRDIDNVNKAVMDSLTWAGIWSDDSLVRESTCAFGQQIKGGSIDLIITEI